MGRDIPDRNVGEGKRMRQVEGKTAKGICVGSARSNKAGKEKKGEWRDVNGM